jgi:TfoX/Sxy family transcriptional regulator of competence genes
MAYDEELAERIREVLAPERGIAERRMFGGLAFLVNGHLSVSASRTGGLMLRVEDDQAEALLREPHVEPFEMRGRPAKGWLRVGLAALSSDDDLRRWVGYGVSYARALPCK